MQPVHQTFFNAPCRPLHAAVLLMATVLAGAAAASSPSAWSAHDREVAESCTKASGLKSAHVVGKAIVFDDRAGVTALLVTGHYPQPHMKNRSGSVLCLFDRKKREATVTPADQLRWATPASTRK